MRGFRWPALALIPSLLVGAAVFDDQERPDPTTAQTTPSVGIAVVESADAASTTWFCAAASVTPNDNLTIVNDGTEDRSGTLTLYSVVQNPAAARLDPASIPIDIEAGGRLIVRPADVFEAGLASAIVELDGGSVLVEHVNTQADLGGTDRRPCATEAGASSYLPVGVTTDDATNRLVLFNPFPEDAVLDITFDTELGGRNPDAYEALVVPGKSSRMIDIGDEVPARERASTFIESRSGRIVVDRVLTFDGTAGRSGLSVSGGISVPRASAFLPAGGIGPNRETTLVIVNPDPEVAAEVDITIVASADRAVEPLERRVFAGTAAVISLSDESMASALSDVDDFSILVRSSNGIPVAVERLDIALADDVAGASPGVSSTVGAPVAATAWLTDVSIADPSQSSLVVLNPSFDTLVEVAVYLADGDEPVRQLELRRGGRGSIGLDGLIDGPTTIRIEATSPVVVERSLVGATSRSTALGLPLTSTVVAE